MQRKNGKVSRLLSSHLGFESRFRHKKQNILLLLWGPWKGQPKRCNCCNAAKVKNYICASIFIGMEVSSSWCSLLVAASKWQLNALKNYAAWLIMVLCLVLWSILPNKFRPTVELSKFRGSKWHPNKFQMVSWCEWIFLLISIVRSNPAELFSLSILIWICPRGHAEMG